MTASAAQLAVVVPIHDVADYLPATLDSILGQSFSEIEVVVVDDGSTDESGAIADEAARRDGRVRVVHQANRGLGAARNIGVGQASAPYLTFVDGDDLVAPVAYQRLVETLERTGSDIAAGQVERLAEDGHRFTTPLMRELHGAERLRSTVADQPLLLADVFAWNKVYRRDFWTGEGLEFPEGIRYEDQPTLTAALLAAKSVDVLTDVVYVWRLRRKSISTRRHEITDLRDRIATKRMSARLVLQRSQPQVPDTFYRRILPVDMWEYFRNAPSSDDEYWQLLRDGMLELWGPSTVPFDETTVPQRQRIMARLIAQDRREDLATYLRDLDERRSRGA